MISDAYDIAVVGAGPVGLLAACLLARRGLSVTVLERSAQPSYRTRAIGIHPPGLAALDEAGIGASIRAEALRITSGAALCDGKTLGTLSLAHSPVLTLPQWRTEQLLADRLSRLLPDALQRGAEVVGLEHAADHVRLRVRSSDSDDATRDVVARFVVAADGVRSSIRPLIGASWSARAGVGSYAMADVPDTDAAPVATLALARGGVVESFPLPDARRRWVVRLPDQHSDRLAASAFRELVRDRCGTVVEVADVSPVVFRARQHLAEDAAATRVVLVGDAAHELSPIGGQGMNLGWLDAVHLRDHLDRHGVGSPALGRFRRHRAAAARRAMRRARFNMAMGAPVHGALLVARNALVRMLCTAPLRRFTVSMFLMRRERRSTSSFTVSARRQHPFVDPSAAPPH